MRKLDDVDSIADGILDTAKERGFTELPPPAVIEYGMGWEPSVSFWLDARRVHVYYILFEPEEEFWAAEIAEHDSGEPVLVGRIRAYEELWQIIDAFLRKKLDRKELPDFDWRHTNSDHDENIPHPPGKADFAHGNIAALWNRHAFASPREDKENGADLEKETQKAVEEGRWKDAVRIGRELVDQGNASQNVLHWISLSCSRLGDHESAVRWAKRGREREDNDAAFGRLIAALCYGGFCKEAISAWKTSRFRSDPRDIDPHILANLFYAYDKTERREEGLRELMEAHRRNIRVDDKGLSAFNGAALLLKTDRLLECLEWIDESLEQGREIETFFKDEDFREILDRPDFLALLDKHSKRIRDESGADAIVKSANSCELNFDVRFLNGEHHYLRDIRDRKLWAPLVPLYELFLPLRGEMDLSFHFEKNGTFLVCDRFVEDFMPVLQELRATLGLKPGESTRARIGFNSLAVERSGKNVRLSNQYPVQSNGPHGANVSYEIPWKNWTSQVKRLERSYRTVQDALRRHVAGYFRETEFGKPEQGLRLRGRIEPGFFAKNDVVNVRYCFENVSDGDIRLVNQFSLGQGAFELHLQSAANKEGLQNEPLRVPRGGLLEFDFPMKLSPGEEVPFIYAAETRFEFFTSMHPNHFLDSIGDHHDLSDCFRGALEAPPRCVFFLYENWEKAIGTDDFEGWLRGVAREFL